jgi:hypothetical protein
MTLVPDIGNDHNYPHFLRPTNPLNLQVLCRHHNEDGHVHTQVVEGKPNLYKKHQLIWHLTSSLKTLSLSLGLLKLLYVMGGPWQTCTLASTMTHQQWSSLKYAHAFQCEGLQNKHTSLKLSNFFATLQQKSTT